MDTALPITLKDIRDAYARIHPILPETPVFQCSTINKLTGRKAFFKAENFQKTGSFKARGALNAVLKLKDTDPSCKGVVTHSSGNHGQALAWAAQYAGLECAVVVPNNTPMVKVGAIQSYGADVVFCEPTPTARQETCDKISNERNYRAIPPYDHYDVMAGQGTIALEFLKQFPDLDAILVPISGGGMSAGIAVAAHELSPRTKVFACEPKGKDLGPSLEAGQRLWTNPPRFLDTKAEGIRIQQAGNLTFPILCQLAQNKVFSLTDDEMINGIKLIWQRMKLVVELSAGASVAALLSDDMRAMDSSMEKIGVILCGGNIDIENLPWPAPK